MKYELRRLGEAVQYATAIVPYGYLFIKTIFYFSVFFSVFRGKNAFNHKIKGCGDKTQSFLFVTTPLIF